MYIHSVVIFIVRMRSLSFSLSDQRLGYNILPFELPQVTNTSTQTQPKNWLCLCTCVRYLKKPDKQNVATKSFVTEGEGQQPHSYD